MKAPQMILSVILALSHFCGYMKGATISVPPTNQTVRLGETASFYCGVTGIQGVGETHAYRKLTPTNFLVALDSSPTNTTKHNITDRYRLHIFDVTISDEGTYECELFPTRIHYTMFLNVVDPPDIATLLWEGISARVMVGVLSNLTCSVPLSRPPATFRWTTGSVDITSQAVTTQGSTDRSGYGPSGSTISITVTPADVGRVYNCYVNIGDMYNVKVLTLPVQISGAPAIQATIAFYLVALFTLTKVL